ncbi:predicted protein [Micromonas commoda]|uniref:DUF7796 domain-containing protein n=1 Tax=Micromonas commoda (strain RCC299 / NOUM17 / CCMP2709) TaxID=296587 RepID=C1EJN6_MICCC|nr:predicted protein [Micromonas commoda]ACO68260.1 predicted protein [Micromonas commoda]|eukprot:XP_002507002.1 predicted protein [Micromonas commoda]
MGAHDRRLVKRKDRECAGAKILFTFLVFASILVQSNPFTLVEKCQKPLFGANVAVLFYGQARTLNRTHCSVTEHILAPLLNASNKVSVFVHGESDGDSWQYAAYLNEVSKLGVQCHIELQDVNLTATQCAMALDDKYEKRMQQLVKEGNTYAAELLTQLRYRESVNSLRKNIEKNRGITFDAVILARPDVVYTTALPPLCRLDVDAVQVPPWQPFGGINDRFLISRSGPALDHYLGLHTGLCDKGFVTRLPRRWKGLNAERIYAWWLHQGGFRIETWLLKKFVFYRLRKGATLWESPDADFGQHRGATVFNQKYNPSAVPWSSVTEKLLRCPPLERH